MTELNSSARDELMNRLDDEGESWDAFIGTAFPIAALIGSATGAALISPEVAGADSWMAVFLATFTWSVGCALATFFVRSYKLQGQEAATAAAVSLVAALIISGLLGMGTLDVGPVFHELHGPPWIAIPVAFLVVAVTTYGIVGALFGAAIGMWLGYRVAQHWGSAG